MGRNDNISYESFLTSVDDESVTEIVALASTLGFTGDIENEYFCGDETTNWSHQHYEVRFCCLYAISCYQLRDRY